MKNSLDAEAEMIGPFERRRLARLGAAAEIPGFPRHDGGKARHARRLAGVGDRIDGLGRRDGEHQVDRLVVDQVLGELAGAGRIGLRVLVEDLDAEFLAAELDAVGQRLPGEVEHIAVGLAEAGERPGARADEADLEAVARLREGAAAAEGERRAAGAEVAMNWRRDRPRPSGLNEGFCVMASLSLVSGPARAGPRSCKFLRRVAGPPALPLAPHSPMTPVAAPTSADAIGPPKPSDPAMLLKSHVNKVM